MTTALRHPYLLAVLAFLVLLAIAFLVLPSLVVHAPIVHTLSSLPQIIIHDHTPVVHHLLGAGLTPDAYYRHG